MEPFQLRPIEFFTNGNAFSGSAGTLRYRIAPQDGQLSVEIWRQDICYELAQMQTSAAFPLTEEGLQQIQAWLKEQSITEQ